MVTRHDDPVAAAAGARALVLATAWPTYRNVDIDRLANVAPQLLVLDANGFLGATLGKRSPVSFRSRGTAAVMSQPLLGRNAVITGANRGLGLAIAEAYLASGANVLLCARDEALLEEVRRTLASKAASDQIVEAVGADVSNPTDVSRVAAKALQVFPQVHVLVNNAGIYGPLGLSEDVDWAAWMRAMEINVYGSVLPCRAFLPHFKQHKDGIRRTVGRRRDQPLPRISAYAASKAAIVRFAESLALEVSPYNIDVNAIAPGALNTRMLEEVIAAGPDAVGRDFHERMVKTKRQGGTPLERGAALAVYLRILVERRRDRSAPERRLGSVGTARRSSERSRAQRCLYAAPDRAQRPRLHVGGSLNSPLGVAIVGCGLIGRKRAAALAGAHLVACADMEPARAKALAKEHADAVAVDRWEDAIQRAGVDIVVVATTNDSLAPVALAAIEAGKHVLIEKPAARTVAELEPLIAASERHDRRVRVGLITATTRPSRRPGNSWIEAHSDR